MKRLVVLTYNIWFKDIELMSRTEALLVEILEHNPDIVCFQEVQKKIWPHLLEVLQSTYPYYHPKTIPQNHYGTAIISKYPILEHTILPFANSKMGRELTICRIQYQDPEPIFESTNFHEFSDFNDQQQELKTNTEQKYRQFQVLIANAHFESEFQTNIINREKLSQYGQTSEILNIFRSSTPEMIMCCDSNILVKEEKKFFKTYGWKDAWNKTGTDHHKYTYDTKTNPHLKRFNRTIQARLDRILYRGKIANTGYQLLTGPQGMIQPSDHYGVMAEFLLPD